MVEWGERGPHMHVPVKPMTLKIDTCRFLAYRLALLRQGKEWLAQCQDNVT